jgi:hypothetical protein
MASNVEIVTQAKLETPIRATRGRTQRLIVQRSIERSTVRFPVLPAEAGSQRAAGHRQVRGCMTFHRLCRIRRTTTKRRR